MVSVEYKNAYSEILEILQYVSKEDLNKIPKEMIVYKTNIFQKIIGEIKIILRK